jgi:hypothetical protein
MDSTAVYLSADSLNTYPYYLPDVWLYASGDDSLRSGMDYDDSSWKTGNTRLNQTDSAGAAFTGIGWFRIHLHIDSSLKAVPLAFSLVHHGASEIYMDGHLIESFGRIKGKDSTINKDPLDLPFVHVFADTGWHVLAVRYANYQAKHNNEKYRAQYAGFRTNVGRSDEMIWHKDLKTTLLCGIMMLLNGIFLTLSLLHLFMFLFYRKDKSNLYFSLFMFCLATGTVVSFVNYAIPFPEIELRFLYTVNSIFCLSCLSLSGFVNVLFSRKKLRFRIIAFLCLLTLTLRFLSIQLFGPLTIALVAIVSLEAVILIVVAVFRRIRGARIIGTGVLIFALFILTIFTIAMIHNDLQINDSTTGGRILLLFLALAILSIPMSMSIYQAWSFAQTNKDLSLQLLQVEELSAKTIQQEKEKQLMLENRKEELEREVELRTKELKLKRKSQTTCYLTSCLLKQPRS